MLGWLSAEAARASCRKPCQGLRSSGDPIRQNFHRHGPVEARVVSFVDLSHAAAADQPLNDIGTKPRPGRQRAGGEDVTERRRRHQQLEHLAAQLEVRTVLDDELLAIAGREIGGVGEQGLGACPRRRIHRWPFMRRPSQNLAAAISRRIVTGDSSLTVATSSSVKPPK